MDPTLLTYTNPPTSKTKVIICPDWENLGLFIVFKESSKILSILQISVFVGKKQLTCKTRENRYAVSVDHGSIVEEPCNITVVSPEDETSIKESRKFQEMGTMIGVRRIV